jgi:hypothetical protein
MEGITIVIFLVRCAANLLICDTVQTEHLRYVEMETCRAEASRLVARRQIPAGPEVWMAKCRYQLASPDPHRLRRAQTSPNPPRSLPAAPRNEAACGWGEACSTAYQGYGGTPRCSTC